VSVVAVDRRRVVFAAFGAALVTSLVGMFATDLGPWYASLRKPAWQPPNWLFGPVWTLIFGLAAISASLAWWRAVDLQRRTVVLALFVANMAFNCLWSVLFFSLQRPDWALVEVVPLWLSVLALIVLTWNYARTASLLLLPYLAWVAFAAVLNLAIVQLNGPFGAR
jgi:benzodiazapine receptor